MVDYAALQATVKDKIDDYGADMTLRLSSHRSYDAATDTVARGPDDYPVKGLFTEFSERDIDGTLIQTGDKRILLNPLDGLPTKLEEVENLKIIYDEKLWNVISIRPLKPGGTTLLYKVHVRS